MPEYELFLPAIIPEKIIKAMCKSSSVPEYDCLHLQLSSPQTRSPAHSESLRWCKLIDWVRCESVEWTCDSDTCHSRPVLFGKFDLCRISSHRHLNYLRLNRDNWDNDEKWSESNKSMPPMPVLASQVYIFFRSSMSPVECLTLNLLI